MQLKHGCKQSTNKCLNWLTCWLLDWYFWSFVLLHSFSVKNFSLMHLFLNLATSHTTDQNQRGGDTSSTPVKTCLLAFLSVPSVVSVKVDTIAVTAAQIFPVLQDTAPNPAMLCNPAAAWPIFRVSSAPEPLPSLVCSVVPIQGGGAKKCLVIFALCSIVQRIFKIWIILSHEQ